MLKRQQLEKDRTPFRSRVLKKYPTHFGIYYRKYYKKNDIHRLAAQLQYLVGMLPYKVKSKINCETYYIPVAS